MKKFGFSGDLIEIQNNQVIKICCTERDRFLRNIRKQKDFQNPYLQAVPILEQGIIQEKHFIKMPLLQCESPLLWMTKTNFECIESFIDLLSKYLNSIIENSVIENFNYSIWNDKLSALQSKIDDQELKQICISLGNIHSSVPFYYGKSHGDLTLSNLFISQDQNITIDVIDFLDNFIESPIHDFVKIRQDTKHLWTWQLSDDIDKNKVVLVLSHIDKRIENIINNDTILNHYYGYFQILNLLRIIPYNKDMKIFRYLKAEIQELSKCHLH